MLLRGLLVAAASVSIGVLSAPSALADPVPTPPPLPDVTTYMPMNAADYTVNSGKWYAFAGPPGVVCVIDSLSGEYGCSGALPGAPDGMNLVSAGPSGAPKFSAATAPYAAVGVPRSLPPNRRLSFRQIFCGIDDAGVVTCLNTAEKTGFVVGPTSTYIKTPPPPAPAPAPAPAG